MLELQTEVPQSGTKLRIDADRQFEGQSGDSVMRVQGQSPDGTATFDAAYVEVDWPEAETISHLLRWVVSPTSELQDRIAQEVQATFSSKLSGRDAQQIAALTAHGLRTAIAQEAQLGSEQQVKEKVEHLAERFERAAATKRQRFSGGNGQSSGKQQR